MGRAQLDYTSENKGSLREPGAPTYDKSTLDQQVATQRKHNFQMSFEQGNQFDNNKGTSSPYKLPASSAKQDRVSKQGASNIHTVQIAHSRAKNDYKSLTALQQSGHKTEAVGSPRDGNVASYSEVREKIAEQTKDLRSSHFALGVNNAPTQPSSSMFSAPPTKALLSGTIESKDARERIQRSNFSLNDGRGAQQPATTQS